MRLNFMSMLIVGLVILSVVVVSDKRMTSFVTKMSSHSGFKEDESSRCSISCFLVAFVYDEG